LNFMGGHFDKNAHGRDSHNQTSETNHKLKKS